MLCDVLLLQLKGKNARIKGQAARLLTVLNCTNEDVLAALVPLLLDNDVRGAHTHCGFR